MKRKMHYNEFAAVQLAKKLMSEEEEDDDEDDDNKADPTAQEDLVDAGVTSEGIRSASGGPCSAATEEGSGAVAVDDDITMASGKVW